MANPFDLLSSRWGHGEPRHDSRPSDELPTIRPSARRREYVRGDDNR
jgi:hypothetical protein